MYCWNLVPWVVHQSIWWLVYLDLVEAIELPLVRLVIKSADYLERCSKKLLYSHGEISEA